MQRKIDGKKDEKEIDPRSILYIFSFYRPKRIAAYIKETLIKKQKKKKQKKQMEKKISLKEFLLPRPLT